MGFWSIFGLYPSLQGWDWPIYHLFYGATSRTIFALALGWIIYACHTGIGGPLNAILSFSLLLPLSILSYSVYLIHMIPVVFTYLLAPFPMQFTSKWRIFGHCTIQLAISYCFGVLCTMIAEMPALNIERILLNKSFYKTKNSSLKGYHLPHCKKKIALTQSNNNILTTAANCCELNQKNLVAADKNVMIERVNSCNK